MHGSILSMEKFVKRLPVPDKHNADDECTLNLLQKQHFYIRVARFIKFCSWEEKTHSTNEAGPPENHFSIEMKNIL